MARLTKEEKQKRKQYLKTCKAYKKELKDIVKRYGPWDNFLPYMFCIQVRHWIDYYSLGYDVHGIEIKDTSEFEDPNRPTRLEIAKELKRLYDDYRCYPRSIDYKALEQKYGSFNEQAKAEVDAGRRAKKKAFFDYYIEYAEDMWD